MKLETRLIHFCDFVDQLNFVKLSWSKYLTPMVETIFALISPWLLALKCFCSNFTMIK